MTEAPSVNNPAPAVAVRSLGRLRPCRECGKKFEAARATTEFCSRGCRNDYNNRRAIRGLAFYDLIMEMRFDRTEAQQVGAWSELCTIASWFRDEDKRDRKGRKSWSSSKRMRNINSRRGR